MEVQMRVEGQKSRDPVARALRTPAFRPRVVSDKRRRQGRKAKHRKEAAE
jgi:hypothetical protein